MAITDSQLRVLRMLRDGVFFPDVPLSTIQKLEAAGLVEQVMGDGVYPYYRLTALGRDAANQPERKSQ